MSNSVASWSSRHINLKFSRDNEQIFALNYENLCDNDYLNRLFTTDGVTEHEQSHLDAWAFVADLPEDIQVFGENEELSKDVMLHRLLSDESPSLKYFDSPSETIYRQIFVFGRIGALVVEKCKKTHGPYRRVAVKSTNSPIYEASSFLSHALSSALRIIEKNIGRDVNLSTLNSLISLLSHFFQYSISANVMPSARLSPVHLHRLRCVLSTGVQHGICRAGANAVPLDVVESLKFALTCAYGSLLVGLNTGSVGDTLLGMSQLLGVSLCAEEKQIELDDSLCSPDMELSVQEKLRMKLKMQEMRNVVSSKKQNPQSSLPQGDDEDVPQRELVGSYEVKVYNLKSKPVPTSQPRGGQSKQPVGDKKIPLQLVKGNNNPVTRPGVGAGSGHYEGDTAMDTVASSGSNNGYPVASWRMATDHGQKKYNPASNAKVPPMVNMPVSHHGIEDSSIHMRHRARAGLEQLQHVPKDILDSVVLNCSGKGALSNDTMSSSSFASTTTPTDAQVWTCGQNSYGELGHGDVNLRRSFSRVSFLDSKHIGCIGAGNEHSLFVSQQGRTYVCGYNDNGQCGMGTNQQVRQPTLIPFLEGEDVIGVYVFNGCEHTLVLTRDGKLFSFGYNYRGQLGLGTTSSEPIPRPIKGIMSRKVTLAACSYHHTVVVCSDRSVFSFGRNDCGQLGHGDVIDKKHPHVVAALSDESIVSVSCGQFHTVLVTSGGGVLVCGKNDYGQLGLDGSDNIKTFSALTSTTHGMNNMLQVCCGYYHTVVLSRNGLVFGFGRNDYGQLGLGHAQPRMYGVHLNSYLWDKNVTSLSAGCYHSVAVTSNGMLYVFGRNNHGQLGTGDIDERHTPHPVDDFVGKKIIQVAAGFYHTIVLVSSAGSEMASRCTDMSIGNDSHHTTHTAPQSSLDSSGEVEPGHSAADREVSDQQDNTITHSSRRHMSLQDIQSGSQSIGVRELFMFLSTHLEDTLAKTKSDTHGVKDDAMTEPAHFKSTTLQLRTAAMVLQVNRQCVYGSLCIEMPFTPEETFSIIGTVVRVADMLLGSCGISDTLKKYSDENGDDMSVDDINYSDLLLHQNPTAFSLLSAKDVVERIASIHAMNPDSNSSVDTEDRDGNVRELCAALQELRLELLFTYFFLQEASCEHSSRVIHMTSTCLSKHFEILLWSTNSRCKFISFLADCLTDISVGGGDYYDAAMHTLSADGMGDTIDSLRCLRLFTQVCFKYRSIDEVISLFQTSYYKGLLVYKYVLDVYTNVSKHQLALRLKDRRDQSYESLRALNTLEHCCAHFTKCSVPVIFESAQNISAPENKDVFDLGCTIISRLYSSAEAVIDIMDTQSVPDDAREALRNGTILCSILPTFMLFALSKVDLCDSIFNLTKHAHPFMVKLQDFVSSLESERTLSVQSLPASKRLKDEDMLLGMTAVTLGSNKSGECTSGKKDSANASFWNRLLKLAVVLCAKLSSSSLGVISAVTADKNSKISEIFSADQHEVWKYCARYEAQTWRVQWEECGGLVSTETVQLIETIRSRESGFNTTYRTIWMTSKTSGVVNIIVDVEAAIAESILRLTNCVLGPSFVPAQVVLSNVWGKIAQLIVTVVRRRTEIMSIATGQSWSDMMQMVLKVVLSTNIVLGKCANRSGLCPLPCPGHCQSKGRAAFRRVALVVVCVNRWKKCKTLLWSQQPSAVVSFYATVLEETIFSLPAITADTLTCRWEGLMNSLNESVTLHSRQTSGISSVGALLRKLVKHPSIQIDVLSILSTSWKQKLQSTSANKCLSSRPVKSMNVVCHSLESCPLRVVAVSDLMLVVQDSISHFCASFCQGQGSTIGVQDITLFCLNVKFLRLLLLDSKGVAPCGRLFSTFVTLKGVVLAMDNKLVELQTMDDRNSGGAPKRASYRERASYLRRALSVVLSFIQTLATTTVTSTDYELYVSSILDVHCELLTQLQKSSQLVAVSENSGLTFPGESNRDIFLKGGKDSNSHRRRCQELIVNPMQFSRNQEGFVVQGEKLLSNFKGIDFTLAFWVYISKKSGSRYSFLLGKVSHNDAWPLIGFRGNDMKIEVLFGRANEFERLTGQTAIPIGAWVHVAVVIDPRKVRLFVNGIMDCQMTTAGNARAILYPVIIGSCPAGVRTRVDYVKEGFDGMVASLKYYTRALSPIHVRVIFDQGPPEAHDARERLSYVTLASCMTLIPAVKKYQPLDSCKKLVSTLHGLLLSDSNQLRYGALRMLGDILAMDVVDDIILSKNHICRRMVSTEDTEASLGCSMLSVGCLPEYSSFHERFMLYSIRLIGLCWSPSVLRCSGPLKSLLPSDCNESVDDPESHVARLRSFLAYCPTFVSSTVPETSVGLGGESPTSGGVVEVPIAREDLLGELCQNIVNLLKKLSKVGRWNTAMATVLYRCLCKCRVSVDSRSEWTELVIADVLGAVVLLGGFPVRPVVGADVHCLYSSNNAKVISIDKATNHVTILTKNSVGSRLQLMTVRASELVGLEDGNLTLPSFVSHSILDLMDSLGGYIHILMSDLLSVYRPDHVFMRHHFFRACRPIEIFIYHQLLRRLAVDTEISMTDIRTRSSLFTTMLSSSIRAAQTGALEDKDSLETDDFDTMVVSLWMKSSPHLASMTDKVIDQDFPPLDCETSFSDFVTRNLGVSMSSFQSDHGTLVRYGYIPELVCTTACEEMSSDYAISVNSLSERYCNDAFAEVSVDEEIAEQAVSFTLRLLFKIRASIVYHSRKLFRSLRIDDGTFESLKFPWKVMLWQQMAQESDSVRLFTLDTLTEQLTSQLLQSHGSDVTQCLISSIKFSAISLLQCHGVKSTRTTSSIVESTDITTRILQAMFLWLRANQNTSGEIMLCLHILKILLPSLSGIESAAVELHVMTLCTMAVHRMIIRLLKGFVPSDEFVEFVNGSVFSQLWARAQEHVVIERGHAPYNVSPVTQKLVYLASGFAVIQRNLHRSRGAQYFGDSKLSVNVHSMTPRTPRPRQVPPGIPPQPIIIGFKAFSVEVDVSEGINQGKRDDEDSAVHVEVAIRALYEGGINGDDNAVYDTIYYGSCSRFVHTGLCPSSMYSVRYRTMVDSNVGLWSVSSEFRTEPSISPFVFDPLKCGSDIIVSQDGRTVSYTGDDNWSTVLGNYPFTNGINSWEIKIASSSTAYIFVGVATSTADLNTFLGGCSEGWGFIGEQALYHGREKVKIYGEPFSAGDVVGVILDFNSGTLSFTRNGKSLGIAFDKIYGELYPAVAFYNVGQEVEIISESTRTLCPPVPLPCSPSLLNVDTISLIHEMLYCIATKNSFSPRVLDLIAEHLSLWTSGTVVRKRAISGSQVFLATKSPLLSQYDLRVGDRVRSQYGIAEIVGAAHGRVWFQTKERPDVWYFSKQQLLAGRVKGLFQRCSYEDIAADEYAAESGDRQLVFDSYTLQELLDPQRWSEEIDEALLQFLLKTCSKSAASTLLPTPSPWDVSCREVCDDFRTIQQQLSRVVIGSVELSHKWGVTGPKRKAVLARIGMLRFFNHLLEHTLPVLLPTLAYSSAESSPRRFSDEHIPPSISLGDSVPALADANTVSVVAVDSCFTNSRRQYGEVVWPVYRMSWKMPSRENFSGFNLHSLASSCRKYIFPDLKNKHFWRVLTASVAKVSKTDDDYDYPEDLPLVKLNRFKSFRAVEVSQLKSIPGDDLFHSTLFCQLWKELRQHPDEKLRISYTHPMDDGQSRTFKVRFEGEGVDDYGGPYREVFQKVCEELQTPDPSLMRSMSEGRDSDAELSGERTPAPCFLPLLLPTANWTAGQECAERYKYTFHPASTSAALLDLFLFLGQVVGIALRSRITLDLPLASFIWKSVVREPLTDNDIASFDAAACSYVQYLGSICQRLHADMDSNEALDGIRDEASYVLQDVTWTVTYSDGRVVELVPNGKHKNVDMNDLSEYLRLYVESRLAESLLAIEAFRDGILSVIPESALKLLNWEELELLVCGSKMIDIERLKANTEYDDDVSPSDSHIVAFWEVLSEFSEEEKAAFLRFVWARPTLPPKDVDFPQKLKIQSAVGDDASSNPDGYLPKAHTCFFSVNLPRYSSKMVMAEKLRYAVVHCTEMDADFRVTEPDVVGWSAMITAPGLSNYSGTD